MALLPNERRRPRSLRPEVSGLENRKLMAGSIILGGATPQYSISDVRVVEGNDPAAPRYARFAVTVTTPIDGDFSVNFATRGDSARPGSDFGAASGTLRFSFRSGGIVSIPQTKTQYVDIPIVQDRVHESEERFFVDLSNASKGDIVRGHGVGTIQDDDPAPAPPPPPIGPSLSPPECGSPIHKPPVVLLPSPSRRA
jgi:hypothetical protein